MLLNFQRLLKRRRPGTRCRAPDLRDVFPFGANKNHERDGGHLNDSPSTAVRLRHLAGVYYLNSRNHRPFVLEFLASTGQPVPASSRAVQFVAYVSATHTGIISQSSLFDKTNLSRLTRFQKFALEARRARSRLFA